MKKIMILIAFGLLINNNNVFGQFMPQYNLYAQNAILVNPAYTGIENFSEFKLGGRQQWVDFGGSPFTDLLSFNGTIRPNNRAKPKYSLNLTNEDFVDYLTTKMTPGIHHGVGGYVIYDRIGAYDRIMGAITYSFHFSIGNKVKAALSPSLGVSNTGFDPANVKLLEPNDPLYQQYLGNNTRFTHLDFGLGAVVYGLNWSVGYSALQVLQNKVYFGSKPTNAELVILHNVMGAYTFNLGEIWELKPSFLVKIPYPNPVGFDVNVKARYKKRFYFGAIFRYNNSVGALIGFNIKGIFNFGYSFDYPINNLRNTKNYGTHALSLGFTINARNQSANYLW